MELEEINNCQEQMRGGFDGVRSSNRNMRPLVGAGSIAR